MKGSVFSISVIVSVVIALGSILFPDTFKDISDFLFSLMTENLSWFYQLVMFGFVVFILIIALSKYGHIRLGTDITRDRKSVV